MSFIEDLGKKVSKVSNDTTQAAKDFSEINRLNSEMKNCEKNITRIFGDMGKLYFELYGEQSVPELQAFIQEINQNKARIEELGRQILEIKGIMNCESCGAEIPIDSQFCPSCGQKIEKKLPPIPEGMKQCPSCGMIIGKDSKFCVKCGTNLG